MLPLDYAVRNLSRSPSRLILGIGGSALMVLLILSAAAFVRGMDASLAQSSATNTAIVLSAGSEESIERSEISPGVASQLLASVEDISSRAGEAFVSPEIHVALATQTKENGDSNSQAVFRGVTPAAFLVHPQVRIIEGRNVQAGADEVIVGQLTATRLAVPESELAVGKQIWVDGRPLTIVGRFSAPQTVMDAEIWCPLTNLQIYTQRDGISCVVVGMKSPDFGNLEAFAALRLDLEITVLSEAEYYSKLQSFYRPIRMMVWGTALLIGLGALLGGLNVTYAAFAARTREVGTLQCLGYGKLGIVYCFVQESVLTAGLGTLLGGIIGLIILPGIAIKFSMGAFGLIIDEYALAAGLIAGLGLGLAGAIPAALSCLRLPITSALKAPN